MELASYESKSRREVMRSHGFGLAQSGHYVSIENQRGWHPCKVP